MLIDQRCSSLVGDFYRLHRTCSQTFRKYYNRYLQSGRAPCCRAVAAQMRRGEPEDRAEIVAHRKRMNRYEIYAVLREQATRTFARDDLPCCDATS